MTTCMPELRRTLVAAACRLHQDDVAVARAAPSRRRRGVRPLLVGGASIALAGTAGALLLVSALGAPSARRTLPLLDAPASHVRSAAVLRALRALRPVDPTGSWRAHRFAVPGGGSGYVQESPDGATLCMLVYARAGGSHSGCVPTAQAERRGMAIVWLRPPDEAGYVALVPRGGRVTLRTGGRTRAARVDAEGIAAGTMDAHATLTIRVGTSTLAGGRLMRPLRATGRTPAIGALRAGRAVPQPAPAVRPAPPPR